MFKFQLILQIIYYASYDIFEIINMNLFFLKLVEFDEVV